MAAVSGVTGMAQLPHLTEDELVVLLAAVDARRLRLMMESPSGSEELSVLWSLSTAVSEAIIAAHRHAAFLRRELEP